MCSRSRKEGKKERKVERMKHLTNARNTHAEAILRFNAARSMQIV
jgi:hypothetical protein